MNYLALIRKQDFIDLYKYGYFYINGDIKSEFKGDIESVKNQTDVRAKLLRCANAFDNAFTYLIIHYEKHEFESSNRVYIEEVNGVYPLDAASKSELETINRKILIKDPLWPDAVSELQKHIDFEDSKKGAQNIWKLFDLKTDIKKYEEIVTDDILKEFIHINDANRRPTGKGNLWLYLMCYQRHEFYPIGKLGYYFDVTHILYNSATGYEVQNFENTKHYNFLNSLIENGPKESMEIYECIKSSYTLDPDKVGFNDLLEYMNNYCAKGFDFYIVACLYLAFMHQYRDGMTVAPEFFGKGLVRCKELYGKNFELACYLLGLTLGHTRTYDCLYQYIGLAIHKSKEQLEAEQLAEEAERKRIEEEERMAEAERDKQQFGKISGGFRKSSNNNRQKDYSTSGRGKKGYVRVRSSQSEPNAEPSKKIGGSNRPTGAQDDQEIKILESKMNKMPDDKDETDQIKTEVPKTEAKTKDVATLTHDEERDNLVLTNEEPPKRKRSNAKSLNKEVRPKSKSTNTSKQKKEDTQQTLNL